MAVEPVTLGAARVQACRHRIRFTMQVLAHAAPSRAALIPGVKNIVAVASGKHKNEAINGPATLEAAHVPHAGQAPRSPGGITREAP